MTHPCLRDVGAAIALALVTIVPANSQEARPTGRAVRPGAERAREMVFKPELSREQAAELATLRNKALLPCAPGSNATIAASVVGHWHGSSGVDKLLAYSPNPIINVGVPTAPWIGGTLQLFQAPCDGHYFFTVSFVKDTFYPCTANGGTQDDVAVYLTRGASATPIALPWTVGAWSGEGAGRRGTGAFGVVVKLPQGDFVQSWVHSDGGQHRCLGVFNFTGFRIGD